MTDLSELTLDTGLYSREAVFRACYKFTDRCYLFLQPLSDSSVRVEFKRKDASQDLQEIVGDFANELIDQRVRADIARETQNIRELIVAQAFADAPLGRDDR